MPLSRELQGKCSIWSPKFVTIRTKPPRKRFVNTVSARILMIHHIWYWLMSAFLRIFPDSKVHGANMGPIWGRQDPGGPHVGPMNFAIWACQCISCANLDYGLLVFFTVFLLIASVLITSLMLTRKIFLLNYIVPLAKRFEISNNGWIANDTLEIICYFVMFVVPCLLVDWYHKVLGE